MTFVMRFLRSFGIGLIFLFCVFGIFASFLIRDVKHPGLKETLSYFNFFEDRFYDYRMKQALNPHYKSKDIVLLMIDDYSLQKIGTWPIPRTVHATMMRKLKNFGVKVVALDVLYPEKAPVCGPTSPDTDLANAFSEFQAEGDRRAIIAYTTADASHDPMKEVPEALYNFIQDSQVKGGANIEATFISENNFPIKELVDSGVGLSHIGMREDLDGLYRTYQLVANVDTLYFASLGLMAYESFVGKSTKLQVKEDGTAEMDFDGKKLDINGFGETKTRFIGGLNNFGLTRLHDVISAKDDDPKMHELLNNKIVYVGSTATGAHDLRPTALDPKMPGVLMHMNITHMLLDRYFYAPSNESIAITLWILIIGMIALLIAQHFEKAILDLIALAVILAVSYWLDRTYYLPQGHELRLFYCYFCFLAVYSWNTFLNFNRAAKEKKQIKGTFSRYVSPAIVNEMLGNPDKLKVGGEKRDITCMFSDVRDFTTISEKLTATELSGALNRYMGQMTDIVFENKGTLDKYIGDAIVAFWGAPLDLPNHAQWAVEGAIKMMEALPAINDEFKAKGLPEFKVGIGLNSGECSVGNMGSDKIFSYTALGDNMNLGARLEGLCKYYGTQILISEFTYERLDHKLITTRPLDKVKVKGKTKPVQIFEVLYQGHKLQKDPAALQHYLAAYSAFLERNFVLARQQLEHVLQSHSEDKPTLRLIKLVEKYLAEGAPEADHDVTTMTEK